MLNPVTPEFEAQLRAALPAQTFREIAPHYLEEPRGVYAGQAGLVLAPASAQEVATILAACNAARVGVLPYGGGTGLVGGQVSESAPAPVLLSMERMTAIRAVYPEENVLIADAGAVLQDIQTAAQEAGRLFPLSLASEGSARIGGNLATNAGGTGVLRYGNARDLCLGLEAVFADGRIWNGLTRLRKDNTGYDLRNLLIGSEGTLGVITGATLKLSPIPAVTGTALFVVSSPAAALTLLSRAREALGETVSAFELIHRQGLEFLEEVLPHVRRPFAEAPEWCVLVDLGLARGQDAEAALAALFEVGLEEGLVSDGLIAQSQGQAAEFWNVREHLPAANRMIGSVSSHDVSVPLGALPDFIARAWEVVTAMGDFRINCFGHVGDGNLHFNVFPARGRRKQDYANQRETVQQAVHDLIHDLGGSVSAEHGIGRMKVDDLERYGDPVKLSAMRAIKDAFDPNGIMNPGAVLRMR